MKVTAKVNKGRIVFASPITEARFYEKFDGKFIRIEPDEAPSAEKRRFFEGCLVPVFFYLNPMAGWKNYADAREVLKTEFLPVRTVKGLKNEIVTLVPSTNDISNQKFGNFIESIVFYLRENHVVPEDAIDPENYKAWRDSAPDKNEGYPPLMHLKELYERQKAVQFDHERTPSTGADAWQPKR